MTIHCVYECIDNQIEMVTMFSSKKKALKFIEDKYFADEWSHGKLSKDGRQYSKTFYSDSKGSNPRVKTFTHQKQHVN